MYLSGSFLLGCKKGRGYNPLSIPCTLYPRWNNNSIVHCLKLFIIPSKGTMGKNLPTFYPTPAGKVKHAWCFVYNVMIIRYLLLLQKLNHNTGNLESWTQCVRGNYLMMEHQHFIGTLRATKTLKFIHISQNCCSCTASRSGPQLE